ncbi:ABC transporter ATP-binding protein [Acinetobacter sp. B5B]|uniref:ABC transporter ATP-binding protein n=1 Tax=Acinetobacter baretiae TaxID=2605383 RepID=UPI0018C30978|nr:ABC transporter ATP-binding protein [Acinetobacter baretiae]MBF7683171.1 ABC transporter ATP-binding protein [Acinetobacter baretiae]
MIEFRSVSFTYPNSHAGITDISLSVATGEIIAVLGQSGCGKTTLLKLLAGFEQPAEGEIWINHKNQQNLSCAERRLGIVFQDYALFPHYTVAQNIAYPLKINRVADIETKVQRMMDLVGLTAMEKKFPSQLSGGQKQRVALARALIFEPQALLLDEPLSALDASLRDEMRTEIKRIQQALNITTFLITHDQEEAMTMADQVAVMGQGAIQQCAPPKEIYHQPNNLAVARFVGKNNIFLGVVLTPTTVQTQLGILTVMATTLAIGSKVNIMVRPEKIIINPLSNDVNVVNVDEVVSSQFLGHLNEFVIKSQGERVKIHTIFADHQLHLISLPIHAIHLIMENPL